MMGTESWLRERFDAERPPEPPGRFEDVVRRGRRRRRLERGTALAAAAVVLLAIPLALGGLDRQTVVIDEPSPGPSGPADSAPEEPEPDDPPDPGGGDTERVDLQALGAAVLAWGPSDGDELERVDHDGARLLWPGPVEVAMPDGQGGVLVQPADDPAVVWLPDADEQGHVRLAEVDGGLLLRGLLPDGRVLYSRRPAEAGEGDAETFFAVALAEGAEPEPVATAPAMEQWTVGPVAAGGELVHASCHLHCGLRPGLADAAEGAESLYEGTAIEGLTATPDGRVVGFVEFDLAAPDGDEPELVLLDGASFETLARIALPLDADDNLGQPVVSLSADGQRALVAVGGDRAGRPPVEVPTTPYLVDDALTGQPQVQRVDAEGALVWADPDAASSGS